jgi:UDP-N-acetylmuramoylalanine--D-glutamate ligase
MEELAGVRTLVLGLGISGRSAANFCAARGARVVAADERPASALAGLDEISPAVELRAGTPLPDPADFDLVVPSPGIPRERYARARRAWGDIELAGRALRVPIVAVTGTNGKSTTVSLVEAMLRCAGLRARAAGNLGTPALSLVGQGLDAAVLEVSSFQLESVERFRPRVAVILNVSPHHLDRHGDLAHYAATKQRLLACQEADDAAVLNLDDPVVRAMAGTAKSRVLWFTRGAVPESAVGFDSGAALVRLEGETRRIPLEGMGLAGAHNLENALAALAAVCALGADPRRAARALADFRGLPHRCEWVATRGGIRFVNDSKATNPVAAQRALESFPAPVIWIAGGRGQGEDYAALAEAAAGRVRQALLIGEAADALERALEGCVKTRRAAGLAEAVREAMRLARPGDVVLLSPACTSFDQFSSFEERGECFRREVTRLQDAEAAQ